MKATLQKKATMFRLNTDLIDKLKDMARREHQSLNNFVECILLDVAYNEPNETTKAAIKEAKSGLQSTCTYRRLFRLHRVSYSKRFPIDWIDYEYNEID